MISTEEDSAVRFVQLMKFLLAASLGANGGPLQKREILYLLAVGYFRAGDYTRSRRLVDDALEVSFIRYFHESSPKPELPAFIFQPANWHWFKHQFWL